MNRTRTPAPLRSDVVALKRAIRKGETDLGFLLTVMSSALTLAADPGEALTVEQLRELCTFAASEIDRVVVLGRSPGSGLK